VFCAEAFPIKASDNPAIDSEFAALTDRRVRVPARPVRRRRGVTLSGDKAGYAALPLGRHHTRRDHVDRNYASMLPFLDRVFGTWYMPEKEWPAAYGVDTGEISEVPAGQLSARQF